MKASSLLKKLDARLECGTPDADVTGLSFDNRLVKPGDCFVCIRGALFDTHDVIDGIAAVRPALIVTARDWADAHAGSMPDANIVSVPDTREAKALIAAAYYGDPAEKLTLIGVTGSKGKTTTTAMIRAILEAAGRPAGLIGSNGAYIGDEEYEVANSTPDSDVIQKFLGQMVSAGCRYAVLEVSSQAELLHRTDGLTFEIGVLMNVQEGDHVGPNEHPSFENYLECKKMLLQQSRIAIVNYDDRHLAQILSGLEMPVLGFGHGPAADSASDRSAEDARGLQAPIPDFVLDGETVVERNGRPSIRFTLHGRRAGEYYVGMPGLFSASNAAAAIACAEVLGLPDEAVRQALEDISVPGRLDMIYQSDDLSVCVDSAHNGFSTRNLLSALREYHPKRIVLVFGCGGNRDVARRSEMGEAAGLGADLSIVTTEHTRFESFDTILKGIEEGLNRVHGNYIVIEDRKEAIRYAILNAEPGDLIAVAGLGHDHYQHIGGKNVPHDDTAWCLKILRERENLQKEDADKTE